MSSPTSREAEPAIRPPAPAPLTPEARLTQAAIRHPRRTLLLAILFAIACALVIKTRITIDSEILNLLPQRFESIQALKVFDREFSQGHELTIGLWDEHGESDLEAFADFFGEALRKEPWVVRVMDRSPMEMPEGVAEVQKLAVPLLLNLPPEEFKSAIARLAPESLSERFTRKRAEIEAGSPKAEMELSFDPLGVVLPALKPLANSFNLDSNRPLGSEDGTLRLAIAVTNQKDFSPEACQETMRTVAAFKERILAEWQAEENGPAPRLLITGRIPYTSEMSLLVKDDIINTIAGSAILVAAVFYIGFRRFKPLFALFHVLLLCCLAAVAAGTLIFSELNQITMGLCAIMIGVGVDFGMLLYGTYEAKRSLGEDHSSAAGNTVTLLGRGILFGATTAAASFTILTFSESPGFAQLGTLIGIGIFTAAVLMMLIFLALLGEGKKRPGTFLRKEAGPISILGYLNLLSRHAKAVTLCALAGLIVLNIIAWSPIGTVQFDKDPRSLEPPNSDAGFALRKIMEKVPSAQEPVLAIIKAPDAQAFHHEWNAAQTLWAKAKEEGAIKGLASPFAFALSPERRDANASQLQGLDFAASRLALESALDREGFAAASFQPAFEMLAALETLSRNDLTPLDWRKTLPQESSWIWVLDRFLSPTPNIGVAYITPNQTLSTPEEQAALRAALLPANSEIAKESRPQLTGWSYVITELLPWSKTKLTRLSILMFLFITTVLAFVYRSVKPLAVLMCSLALSVGAMVALLKFTGVPLNLFNVLAFPLVLGIGVDYGIYTILAVRQQSGNIALATVVKPILLSGLTTIAGFGSLGLAQNPALSTLGLVCALGVASCLASTLLLILPTYLWRGYR